MKLIHICIYLPTSTSCTVVRIVLNHPLINLAKCKLFVGTIFNGVFNQSGVRVRWLALGILLNMNVLGWWCALSFCVCCSTATLIQWSRRWWCWLSMIVMKCCWVMLLLWRKNAVIANTSIITRWRIRCWIPSAIVITAIACCYPSIINQTCWIA